MSSQSIRYIANNPAIQHILTAPISELGLPDRVTLLVERAGIETFGDLIERSAAEMLKTRQLGEKTLAVIRERVQELLVGEYAELGITSIWGTYRYIRLEDKSTLKHLKRLGYRQNPYIGQPIEQRAHEGVLVAARIQVLSTQIKELEGDQRRRDKLKALECESARLSLLEMANWS